MIARVTLKPLYFISGLLLWWLVAGLAAHAAAPGITNQIQLGRVLFQDKNLSLDRTVSCASCHQADHAFADPRPVSIGVGGRHGTRNAPSLLEIRYYTSFFWDGRAESLTQQARNTIFDRAEFGFTQARPVLDRIRDNATYDHAFRKLDGISPSAIRLSDVIHSLVAYERSLTTPDRMDQYLAGKVSALSPPARRGLAIFRGKADCASCHLMSGHAAPLTDNLFHRSGIGLAPIASALATLATQAAHLTPSERYARAATDTAFAALGRYLVTLNPGDIGKFRTPSLRDVAQTAPYMHDGSVATLSHAIDIELYYRGLKLGYPIILTDQEKQDLLSFLDSLSSLPANAAVANPQTEDPAPAATARGLPRSPAMGRGRSEL